MTYPYISKRVVNAGSEEEPDFREMPHLIWIPGKDRGPYKECRTCRETMQKINADIEAENQAVFAERIKQGNTAPYKGKSYRPFQIGYSIPGAANCAKHIIRFHKKNGTWTEELEADVLRREAINEKSRKGAYYLET